MDQKEIKKYLKELKIKSEQFRNPEKLAAEIAYNCVRNNTIIEKVHSNGGISQREMMIFMMEVTTNIEIALADRNCFFTTLTEGFGRVPSYWQPAPSTGMIATHEEYSKWQDEILEMSDEEWSERGTAQ